MTEGFNYTEAVRELERIAEIVENPDTGIEDIDKYIKADQNKWETGIKLREKAKETPKTELKQVGEMSMNIVATSHSFTIYLHHYHLPIYYKKDYEEMVMLLQQAKLKTKEVRSKLFA